MYMYLSCSNIERSSKKTLRVSRVRVEIRYNGDDMLGTLIDAGPDREDYALYA
jgi:hypothetical protein